MRGARRRRLGMKRVEGSRPDYGVCVGCGVQNIQSAEPHDELRGVCNGSRSEHNHKSFSKGECLSARKRVQEK